MFSIIHKYVYKYFNSRLVVRVKLYINYRHLCRKILFLSSRVRSDFLYSFLRFSVLENFDIYKTLIFLPFDTGKVKEKNVFGIFATSKFANNLFLPFLQLNCFFFAICDLFFTKVFQMIRENVTESSMIRKLHLQFLDECFLTCMEMSTDCLKNIQT